VAVDEDDPVLEGYFAALDGSGAVVDVLSEAQTGNLVRATNSVSLELADLLPESIIGNLGDDHIARTEGWDEFIEAALQRPGIAYGDDLLQGERLPTAPFISAKIVNALGWYALPCLHHMFIDDAWRALGAGVKRLTYLPGVVFEHMHPGAGKAPMDDGYMLADATTEVDRVAYERWWMTDRKKDLEKIRNAL
jgi:hypothetical protein